MKTREFCLALGVAAGLAAVASPKIYTVRPGDDLAATVARIRAARAATKAPCVLELADGTYSLAQTLELDARDDGMKICSAQGAHAVLDGGTRVTGFKPFRDGIYVADVSCIPCVHEPFFCYGGIGLAKDANLVIDLYRDGTPLVVAREPDTGFLKTGKVNSASDFVFACSALEQLGCRGEKGMFATGYWRYLWADETFALSAQGPGLWKLDVAQGIPGKSNYRDLQPNMPFFVCNSLKFLNRNCEWVLDREHGKIYVKGKPSAEYVLTTLAGPLLRIKGAARVHIEGLTFRYGRGNGVEVYNCRKFVFRDNLVERFGGTGVICTNAKDCVLEGNLLKTFGYKAVMLSGGDRATLTPSGCVFSDNEVTDTGRLRRTYSHGVAIGGCGVQVVHNYFHDLPSSSICMPGNNHLIASNITERAVLESDDQGGIDIFGSPFFQGNRVIHNIWRDIGRAATGLNATCGKAGVRLDDQVSGFYIYGNLFDNCSGGHFGGVQIHGGRDNDVVNNVFTRCRWAVSFSPWNIYRWHQHWYPNCKSPETVNVFSPVWKAQYGDLMRLKNMGNVNRITRNIVIGAEALTNGRCKGEVVLKDNLLLPAGATVDGSKLPGFEPLPPESSLGPRRNVLRHAGEPTYGILPEPAHVAYQEREILGLVCWGLNTFTGQEWGFGNVPPSKITADRLDPAQWVRAMKAAEIKSVVLVAKHHDGFNLWPSPLNLDYSMAAVPAPNTGRDLVRELADACRKEGLGFGVYLSPWDRHQGSYATPAYVDYFHKQWEEVLTRYGDICEVWLDGANGGTGWYGGVKGAKGEKRSISKDYYDIPRLIRRVRELHPGAILFGAYGEQSAAWCGNEAGVSPDTWWCVRKGRHDDKEYWMPSETDTPFRRHGWYWHPHDQPKPLKELVSDYFTSVGRGAVLDFGISPDRHGQICPEDAQRMKEFGDYVRAFNATNFAEGAQATERRNGNELVVELALAGEKRFNCIDIREPIELGQRVAEYRVEVLEDGTWRQVAKGTTVGHRRLARFALVRSACVRVTVKGRAKPLLKPIALRYAPPVRGETCGAKDTYVKDEWRIVENTCPQTHNAMGAIDGDARTLWHTHPSKPGPQPPPQSFAVDCRETLVMHGFDYLPRQDHCLHGMVDAYEFRVSTDGKTWQLVSSGEFGNLKANPVRQRVTFAQPVKARYFRFTATRAVPSDGSNRVAVAEIDVW